MLPQPKTAAELEADEIEGAKIRAQFSANLKTEIKKTHPQMLFDHFQVLKQASNQFYSKLDSYGGRKDLKNIYSAGQIAALAAAETLMPLLDMPPREFHGLFVMCCFVVGTQKPPKLQMGKKRVTFKGIHYSSYL